MDNVVKPAIANTFCYVNTREGNNLDLVPRRLLMSYRAKVLK